MVIAFVIDDVSQQKNGTVMTALRSAEALRARGHEVRIIAHGADTFNLQEHNMPLVSRVSAKQDFIFGAFDDALFQRALVGVDLVHIFLPFQLGRKAYAYARAHNIAVSAAFHLQPENITYNAHMGSAPLVCNALYAHFRKSLYNHVRHVHCPSKLIADDLKQRGYTSQLHVISNGVPDDFVPKKEKKQTSDDLFHIVNVGRLGEEKDQQTLIRAVAASKYADSIQVHIAGKGPLRQHLEHEGAQLAHPVQIAFLNHDELLECLQNAQLYVHASYADSEAISCIEAIATGLVPIIATSKMSATSQFALHERSLYPAGDIQALARRIDWWIEHPQELDQFSDKYAASAEQYRLSYCIDALEDMFAQAIEDDRLLYHGKSYV